MIRKSTHPWANFLHARRLCLEWLRKECNYNDAQIADAMKMDEVQVKLILMTEVEE
jgi:hypothetical protein